MKKKLALINVNGLTHCGKVVVLFNLKRCQPCSSWRSSTCRSCALRLYQTRRGDQHGGPTRTQTRSHGQCFKNFSSWNFQHSEPLLRYSVSHIALMSMVFIGPRKPQFIAEVLAAKYSQVNTWY